MCMSAEGVRDWSKEWVSHSWLDAAISKKESGIVMGNDSWFMKLHRTRREIHLNSSMSHRRDCWSEEQSLWFPKMTIFSRVRMRRFSVIHHICEHGLHRAKRTHVGNSRSQTQPPFGTLGLQRSFMRGSGILAHYDTTKNQQLPPYSSHLALQLFFIPFGIHGWP